MGPVTVEVRDKALQDEVEMAAPENECVIEALAAQRPHEPFRERVRSGARIGVRMTVAPSIASTPSKPPAYFESRSRMR
jgi:hypothetical protein